MRKTNNNNFPFYQEPLVNINTGAVALTGTVILAGAATALIWKSFMKDQFYYRKGNGRQKSMNKRKILFLIINSNNLR